MKDLGGSFDGDLRSQFLELVKQSASEEKFIQFISSTTFSDKLNSRSLEIILDLSLAVVDEFGYANLNHHLDARHPNKSQEAIRKQAANQQPTEDSSPLVQDDLKRMPDLSSYDGDDEELDDTVIFPCHVVYDDCHPELLTDYHREHLKPSRTPIQIIRLPKVCEFVLGTMFANLRESLASRSSLAFSESDEGESDGNERDGRGQEFGSHPCDLGHTRRRRSSGNQTKGRQKQDQTSWQQVRAQMGVIVRLVKKINKVCLSERRNCRILSKTGILSVIFENLNHLLEVLPDEQHIYLEPLIKFAFTLSDFKISGENLRQLFRIMKNEETNLDVVLKNLQNLLNHHYRILRNIQPSKSINFPTASRTAEEIEFDRYLANSWHWRLRSKVIENKRRRSRGDSQNQDLRLQTIVQSSSSSLQEAAREEAETTNETSELESNRTRARFSLGGNSQPAPPTPQQHQAASIKTSSSWLECSLMTPLSNISPLIHQGQVKFCCSMWLSVCGDLLVVESNRCAAQTAPGIGARRRNQQQRTPTPLARSTSLEDSLESQFHIDWLALNGHWLRLTSRRRLVRRHKNKLALSLRPRKRRMSARIRRRQTHDQEDEEQDEKEERAKKSDAEVTQGHSRSGRGFKLLHSSLRRHPENNINRSLDKRQQVAQRGQRLASGQRTPLSQVASGDSLANSIRQQQQQQQPLTGASTDGDDELSVMRMRQHTLEQLVHLVSFAMDSLTVEMWLNVKCMTYYVRTCRVTREGQTDVHDEATLTSHLEANGAWANVLVCLEEEPERNKMKAVNLKVIVNGVHEESTRLVFTAHRSAPTNFALLIGCERSTFGYVWKLSQINLYKNIPNKNMPIYLLGKGPDFWSFTNFRQQSLLPLPDITQRHRRIMLDPKVLLRYSSIDEEQTLNWLTQNIVISYVAQQPRHFLDYSPSMAHAHSILNPLPADYEFSNSAERFIQAKTLDFSRSIRFNQNLGIGSALVEAGGIESVLVSFAEVVRRSNESSSASQTHALAFAVLLKMVQSNSYHLNKFLDELNGLKLMEYILAHPKCQISCELLESYLDFCLMSPGCSSLQPGDGGGQRHATGSRPLVKSAKLIYHLMISWRVWHREAKVAKLLYRRLIKLLHTSAPQIVCRGGSRRAADLDYYHIEHNFRMITQAGGIDILMDVLRECLLSQDDNSPDYIDHELIGQIVQLISLLFKQPPGLDVMLDIAEFLLFLHPDPKAYVEVSQDRIGFLHKIEHVGQGRKEAFEMMQLDEEEEEERNSDGLRSAFSMTPSSESSESLLDGPAGPQRQRATREADMSSSRAAVSQATISNGPASLRGQLADFIDHYNQNGGLHQSRRQPTPLKPTQTTAPSNRESAGSTTRSTSESVGGSNRNYAIARIADMLHFSIIEPTSASNTLAEALSKGIIDARKFIILANNDSAQVREKVLRLFLYCLRACYQSNLRNIIARYEQNTDSANYKLCTPIHLMARQLLKYNTTSKMIHLCHGILVGVTDFEAADTFFATFEIDANIDQFQLNCLVLLVKLITRLSQHKEIAAGLRVARAYLKQLVRLHEVATVSVIIRRDLIDSMMSLYFAYVEGVVQLAASRHAQANGQEDSDATNNGQNLNGTANVACESQLELLVQELDKVLIFIVRFYLQEQTSSEMAKSIDELLLYFELLNSQVPAQFKGLLRDRSIKVLLTKLRFCAYYESCARRRAYNGRFEFALFRLKNMIRSSSSNRFSNVLPEFEPNELLELDQEGVDWPDGATGAVWSETQTQADGKHDDEVGGDHFDCAILQDGTQVIDELILGDRSQAARANAGEPRDISESDVIERIRTTFAMIVNFITTREPDEMIPSPLERRFIMICLRRLARLLSEHDNEKLLLAGRNAATMSQWTLILAKLGRPLKKDSLRSQFIRLILYLLSPSSNGMNLDERKYFAHQILDQFQVDQLLVLLGGNNSHESSEHKILLAFLRDLIDYDVAMQVRNQRRRRQNSACDDANDRHESSDDDDEVDDDDDDDEEDEMLDDTEIKLRQLISGLESETSGDEGGRQNGAESGQLKCGTIWLEGLAKARDDQRLRLDSFRLRLTGGGGGVLASGGNFNQKATLLGAGSLESLTAISSTLDERDRFLDEAVGITRDVVNDKHEQRKAYLEDVKQNKIQNYHMRQQWLSLIIGHTHERAVWHLADYYPKSWELNPVEGPSRTRRRLRPCKLRLESRFLRGSAAGDQDDNRRDSLHDVDRHSSSSSSSSIESKLGGHSSCAESEQTISDGWYSSYSPHPLCSLIINNEQSLDSNELRIRMFTTDKINFNCDCSIIRPNEVCHGEVSIASWCIHFIGNRDAANMGGGHGGRDTSSRSVGNSQPSARVANTHYDSQSTNRQSLQSGRTVGRPATRPPLKTTTTTTVVEDLWFDEIVEIWDRRYQLQDVGLEIFLTNNMTYLLSFRSNADREDFKQNLAREQHKMINLQRFNLTTSLTRLTQLWRDGKLTNFDYLTCLNKLAGRSFNDLMQYPVFPFVLSNYKSDSINLNEPQNFRNLRRPMAIQNEAREENFKNVYQMSLSSGPTINSLGLSKPYHYGNHYSNSATVLHFLVRLPPFTQMLIEYQDNNFDQPDRTFHAAANTWQLITRDSNTDFKELIPEFFFLPEMFINLGNLELGRKQNNELVDDVILPNWCPNRDARLFTLIHRQALESAFVSENLHHWIDLIFGYKQTGKAAIDALNVFHPATYYGGIDLGKEQRGNGSGGISSASSSKTAAATTSAAAADSLSAINLVIARSSSGVNFSSLSSTAELQNSSSNAESGLAATTTDTSQPQSPRRLAINKFIQADIERSALETMIKTYGQMPRQLFSAPMKQRSSFVFARQFNESHFEKQQQKQRASANNQQQVAHKSSTSSRQLEPLKQVTGLRWGSYVGSPSEGDVIAVKHKRIILEPVKSDYRVKQQQQQKRGNSDKAGRSRGSNSQAMGSASISTGAKLLSKQSDKFHFCLLPNGDVAILRNNTSLMLDYRADRKSSGTAYQLSIPSARYSRRAGLSRVSRMNLFSNMIISRQQFSFLEPIHQPGSDLSGSGGSASSLVASLTGGGGGGGVASGGGSGGGNAGAGGGSALIGGGSGGGSRAKFSLDSLNLVSWFYIDGVVRVKHPAPSNQQPSIPLVQANTIVDTMTTCLSVPELNLLLIGYRSGSICAHIVSTAYETVPIVQKTDSIPTSEQLSSNSNNEQRAGGPSAVHFLNTTSDASLEASLLGPGRVSDRILNDGEPHSALSLAGKTLQSVRSMHKTTRWLYCHDKRINCIKINVSFGIVVTASDDGTSVIWDLNSLTFVRTIDYKLSSLRIRKQNQGSDTSRNNNGQRDTPNSSRAAHESLSQSPSHSKMRGDHHYVHWTYGRAQEQKLQDYLCTCNQDSHDLNNDWPGEQKLYRDHHQDQSRRCFICGSGVSLIATSDTLGDIVTIKQLSNRLAASSGNDNSRERSQLSLRHDSSDHLSARDIPADMMDSSRTLSTCSSEDTSLTSVIYLHTINGSLVNFVNCHAHVTAVSYSNAPEGISINVIVVGMVDGLVRLYSSWDLSRVKEFRVSGLESPISDIMYTRDSQLMYIAHEDGQMVVLRNKKKGSASLPKEWIL